MPVPSSVSAGQSADMTPSEARAETCPGTWIVLLRAVNVGRANRIGMSDLRASLEALGYRDVRTYLQSGNAVFCADCQSSATLAAAIHDRLVADSCIDVGVIVLSASEFDSIARGNPLLAEESADESHMHVIVFEQPSDPARFDSLSLPSRPGERAVLLGRAIYLALPFGMGRTKLTGAYFERALGQAGTARNWRTVTALIELACERA